MEDVNSKEIHPKRLANYEQWSNGTLICLPGQYNSIVNGGCGHKFCGLATCVQGKDANGTASRDLSGCISCPLTKTCPRDGTGSPAPCPAGRFGAEEGLTSLKCSGACDPGHYCPVGATNSTFRSCPAGRFVSVPGSSNVSNCSTCKASFYCDEAALFERPCPSGTYGNETGLESSRCSGDCPPGFFCLHRQINPNVVHKERSVCWQC